MPNKTPEEIAALKAKFGDKSAEKEAAKAAKKAKYGGSNSEKNMPVCEIRVPWNWADEPSNKTLAGREIDPELPCWQDYLDRMEQLWRQEPAYTQHGFDASKIYTGPCKRRIIRT